MVQPLSEPPSASKPPFTKSEDDEAAEELEELFARAAGQRGDRCDGGGGAQQQCNSASRSHHRVPFSEPSPETMVKTTRRFFSRPAAVLLSSMGLVCP